MEEFDKDFMYFVINKKISFPLILKKAGYEGYDYRGNVYCPFHDNTDTPAAKLYKDDDGDKLWCWGECRRMYNPADVLKRGMIDIRLTKVFYRIWKKLSENEKEYLRNKFGQPQEDYFSDEFKSKIEMLEAFKNKEIDYKEYLSIVVDAMKTLEKGD
ncbi:MAG: hypothetical protein ACOC56_06945 [Atribacterota bacterium]